MIMMLEETWRKLVNHYETQIDVTQFGSARHYLHSGGRPITDVVFVRQQQFLAKVAAALDELDVQGQHRIRRWLEQGHIATAKSGELLTDGALDEGKVPADCPCEVIYRPPFCAVFLRENTGVVFNRSIA